MSFIESDLSLCHLVSSTHQKKSEQRQRVQPNLRNILSKKSSKLLQKKSSHKGKKRSLGESSPKHDQKDAIPKHDQKDAISKHDQETRFTPPPTHEANGFTSQTHPSNDQGAIPTSRPPLKKRKVTLSPVSLNKATCQALADSTLAPSEPSKTKITLHQDKSSAPDVATKTVVHPSCLGKTLGTTMVQLPASFNSWKEQYIPTNTLLMLPPSKGKAAQIPTVTLAVTNKQQAVSGQPTGATFQTLPPVGNPRRGSNVVKQVGPVLNAKHTVHHGPMMQQVAVDDSIRTKALGIAQVTQQILADMDIQSTNLAFVKSPQKKTVKQALSLIRPMSESELNVYQKMLFQRIKRKLVTLRLEEEREEDR